LEINAGALHMCIPTAMEHFPRTALYCRRISLTARRLRARRSSFQLAVEHWDINLRTPQPEQISLICCGKCMDHTTQLMLRLEAFDLWTAAIPTPTLILITRLTLMGSTLISRFNPLVRSSLLRTSQTDRNRQCRWVYCNDPATSFSLHHKPLQAVRYHRCSSMCRSGCHHGQHDPGCSVRCALGPILQHATVQCPYMG
jgi:hypothetical protein